MAKNTKLKPHEVYRLILKAIPKVTGKYPITDEARFAWTMLAVIEQESTYNTCLRGYTITDSGWAWGLTQVTTGTMTDICKRMGWRQGDRCDAQYSVDLGVAQLAWILSREGDDYFNSLYKYNAGAYSKKINAKAYAYKYAGEVLARYDKQDRLAILQDLYQSKDFAFDMRQEFR